MVQADNPNTTNPSDVRLTRKGELYADAHDPNRDYFAALATLRKQAVEEIDRLLSFLDNLDGDTDLEPSADAEPSIGWTGMEAAYATYRGQPVEDRELDLADDEETGDEHEPSLGWNEQGDSGEHPSWGMVDAERDDCDLEDGGDEEPDHEDGHHGGQLSERYLRRLRERRLEAKRREAAKGDPVYVDAQGRAWVGLMPRPDVNVDDRWARP